MTETTKEQITKFIKSRFPQAEIDNDVDIFSLGYINSLFAMELVMFVEKTYGFTVPTDELRIDNFRTVAALSALVERHRIVILVG